MMASPRPRTWRAAAIAIAAAALLASSCRRENGILRSDYNRLARAMTPIIEREMEAKGLPSFAIAFVDDKEIVWSQGFGYSDLAKTKPATPDTVYRVGSVSKLFSAIAVMQLVEQRGIDIDAPVSRYMPEFHPENPFGTEVTLRHLMSHRGGLVREPPVGNYFDDSEPILRTSAPSVNLTRLVYEPGTRVKYSNLGGMIAGYAVERFYRRLYQQYIKQFIFEAVRMPNSDFFPRPDIAAKRAEGLMWSYDGREFPAPTFELGMMPAGSLYSTVTDLGNFTAAILNQGASPTETMLRPDTMAQMLQPQFAPRDAKSGFGLGFAISELDGHRAVGHGGAIYGFSTQLTALPDDKLGVVAVASRDVANTIVHRISDYALRWALADRAGEDPPAWETTELLSPEAAKKLDGAYRFGDEVIELAERNGRLIYEHAPIREELRRRGDQLITDGAFDYGTRLYLGHEGRVAFGGKTFVRIPNELPPDPPAAFRDLIGEYGWDHNTLFILEKYGSLYALIEWTFLYPLTPLGGETYAFPDYGLYHGERLEFHRDPIGAVNEVVAAGIVFPRKLVGAVFGGTFRIRPVKLEPELRAIVAQSKPPESKGADLQPDLVDLMQLDPSLRFDIRYATTNNFMGMAFYAEPRAFLQRPAAEALLRVHNALKSRGYGLLIYDAYRPWPVSKMFWEATPEDMRKFVADPSVGSIHNRGAAVDLTLYDLDTGAPVEMPGGYDEFSARSYPDYMGGTSAQRWRRELLRDAMEAEGFTVYPYEWWHFNYKDAERYPILSVEHSAIKTGR